MGTAPDQGLDRVYREQAPRLWRALVGYSADPEIASDALSEAFAQALAGGERIREPERWEWVAAFRIARGELKARAVVASTDPPISMPDDAIELVSALARLPPKQRAALVLHYYAGYKAREIAEIVGSSAATAGLVSHWRSDRVPCRTGPEGNAYGGLARQLGRHGCTPHPHMRPP